MATNIELNEPLLKKAMDLGVLKTKKDAVNHALVEFVQRREQIKTIDFFGQVDTDQDYDDKKQRKME